MKKTLGLLNPKWVPLFFAIGLAGAASSICAQTWNYVGSFGHEVGGYMVAGKMTLKEVGGEYKFQMMQGYTDACYRPPMKASVERTQSTITITTTPTIAGCVQNRFVLNTDGSGGTREFLDGGQWRPVEAFRLGALEK